MLSEFKMYLSKIILNNQSVCPKTVQFVVVRKLLERIFDSLCMHNFIIVHLCDISISIPRDLQATIAMQVQHHLNG